MKLQLKIFKTLNMFSSENVVLFQWLRNHGLLTEIITCPGGEIAKIQRREKAADQFAFRCKKVTNIV